MPSEPSNDEIRNAFSRALDRVVAEDGHLFRVNAGERSLTFRLGHYLQIEFPDWQVDSEYNRSGEVPKALRAVQEKAVQHNRNSKSKGYVFPDIILHGRGEHGPNLLAVEAKKAADLTPKNKRSDRRKLRGYQGEFGYRVTAFVVFRIDEGGPAYDVQFNPRPNAPGARR